MPIHRIPLTSSSSSLDATPLYTFMKASLIPLATADGVPLLITSVSSKDLAPLSDGAGNLKFDHSFLFSKCHH